jgi:hypothetical protein
MEQHSLKEFGKTIPAEQIHEIFDDMYGEYLPMPVRDEDYWLDQRAMGYEHENTTGEETMQSNETPKPKAPVKAETTVTQAPKPEAKKPAFVPTPHLMQKPFRDHEGLSALRQNLGR